MVFDLLSPIAGLIGAGVSSYGQSKTNSANAQMARDQMNFQERMSNTAWQRAVKDMMKAGINPGLAYSQGGASSPVGAMPALANPYESVHGSASTSADSYRANQLMMSQLDVNNALASMYKAQTTLNAATSAKVISEVPKNTAQSGIWTEIGKAVSSASQISNSMELFKKPSVAEEVLRKSKIPRVGYTPIPKRGK